MSNIRKIDEFLNFIKDCALNGYEIHKNFVYGNLVMCGVDREKRDRIDKHFDYWIEYFKNRSNIQVFNSSHWKYFCQFRNEGRERVNPYNKIKMYIPLDKEHIRDGAVRIFNFLEMNNISHESKIGSDIRFDDVVIRVDDIRTAEVIKDFVMRDRYISEGLIDTNPFAFNDSGISFAWDGYLSFNSVVSSLISDYINDLKNKNMLGQVNSADFVKFVSEKFNKTFITGEKIDKFISDNGLEDDVIDGSIDWKLVNYMDVMKLIILSIDPKNQMKDFYAVIGEFTSEKHQDEAISMMNDLRNSDRTLDSENKEFERLSGIWENVYNLLVNKYGAVNAKKYIDGFMATGNYRWFTRENNIRNTMITNNIDAITLKKIIFSSKISALEQASLETYYKYGYEQLCSALICATYGDFFRFTNQNRARERLIGEVTKEEVNETIRMCLMNAGINLLGEEDIYEKYANYIISRASLDKTR